MMEGGCECGQVRYRVVGEPIFVSCCHCRQCQKLTGSAFALNAWFEADRIELTKGGGDLLAVEQGATRCPGCSTLLWATHPQFGENILFLRAGTLDEGERIEPSTHFFVRSKHPWVAIPEGAPTFDTLPGEGDPSLLDAEARARLDAARGG